MGDFGIPFLIIGMLAILAVDIFSVSYLKTALLDLRMKKPGFFLSSAGICIMSIVLSWIMTGVFLNTPNGAIEAVEVPKAGEVSREEPKQEEPKQEEPKQEEPKQEEPEKQEPEAKEPELAQATVTKPVMQSAITPTFSVWRGYYKKFEYNFIEIENATPYIYMPSIRGDFQSDLNNIKNNREGGNIIVMANASLYNTTTTDPLGTTIQNGKILSRAEKSDGHPRTLVIDEKGNVGYAKDATNGQISSYIDAKTGKTVTGRRIVSAAYGFGPVRLNNKTATEYSKIATGYRARQMFCVKQNSYMIISNTGEGEDGGGWNFDDMAKVAEYRGCISAFSFDGGGSTATAYRLSLNNNFSILATTKRHDPTFIVFTADNLAPRGR